VIGVDDVDTHPAPVSERRDQGAQCLGSATGTADHTSKVVRMHAHFDHVAALGTLLRDPHVFGMIDNPLDEVFEGRSEQD